MVSKLLRTFAPMKEPEYYISGVNAITGQREAISHPMAKAQAQERLQREIINRKHQRYAAHKSLRLERCEPVQTTLNFEEYE